MTTLLRSALALAAAAISFGVDATPAAAALRAPTLRAYAAGFIYDSGVGAVGPFQDLNAATGPVHANVEAGAVLAYRYPGVYPDYQLETTLYAAARTHADYGTNRAALELNFRPVSGDDRGAYPAGNFSGSLPFRSSLEPNARTESSWTDTFVIQGGTGVGTASVSVALHGHAQSRYGANGTIWYDAEPSFELFGTSGRGSAQYSLDILYDVRPPGVGSEYSDPIRWEQDFLSPLLAFVTEIGVQPEILTGSFVFEYGVPFGLRSSLGLSGYNQINIDFDHTATLSMFDLPDGASLTSGSRHIYPTSVVPEPSSAVLLLLGVMMATPISGRRRSSSRRWW